MQRLVEALEAQEAHEAEVILLVRFEYFNLV